MVFFPVRSPHFNDAMYSNIERCLLCALSSIIFANLNMNNVTAAASAAASAIRERSTLFNLMQLFFGIETILVLLV